MPPGSQETSVALLEVLSVGSFHRKYGPIVFRWAHKMLPRYADDLAQETMIEATRDLDRRRANGNYSAWLRSIFKNNYKDFWKRLRAVRRGDEWRAASLDATDVQGRRVEERVADTISTPSLKASRRERLLRAIGKLPPGQREVTRLVFVDEVSPLQVASQLKLTDEQVQGLLIKAERNLKKRLEELRD